MVGDPVKAKKISDILLAEYGVYVQPINYPTVPRGSERLRFTPGPAHTPAMMHELTGALVEIWGRLAIAQGGLRGYCTSPAKARVQALQRWRRRATLGHQGYTAIGPRPSPAGGVEVRTVRFRRPN